MNKYISDYPIVIVEKEEENLLACKKTVNEVFANEVISCSADEALITFLEESDVAVVVLDLPLDDLSGLSLLKDLVTKYPLLPVIVITESDKADTAPRFIKSGAFDCLTRPLDRNRLVSSIEKALEIEELRSQVSSLKEYLLSDSLEHEEAFRSIITKSKKVRAIFQYIEATATSSQPVLITGETGTGKNLFARAIHEVSGRKGAFVTVNVAGLDDRLFCDTLFGHAGGANGDNRDSENGLIEKSAEGTLFLEEIGDLSETCQQKLLRLLQDNSYCLAGSDTLRKSSARIVVATNRDLSKAVSQEKFRKDLYYRLISHKIYIPPLRERVCDISLLTRHFISQSTLALKKKKPALPPELFDLLSTYAFPGNVRELEGMVYDAVTSHKTGILSTKSFREAIKREKEKSLAHLSPNEHAMVRLEVSGRLLTLKEAEELLISKAMEKANNNQRLASEMLGITRQALNKRLIRKRDINQ